MTDKQPVKVKITKPKRALLSQAVQTQQPTIITPRSNSGNEAATTPSPRAGRVGTKMIGGHFGEAAAKQLKIMAAEQDKTGQVLLEEALNDLFRKYGKEPIA